MSLTVSPDSPAKPDPLPSSANGNRTFDPTINWLTEAVEEGEALLAAQSGWGNISRAIDAIMSADDIETFDPRSVLSQTKTNRVALIAEQIAALMTDTKPFWDYSVANRRFEQHAEIYGKLATFWYQRRNIDLRIADAIKYYTVGGTGYLHLFWNEEISDIDACAEDPRNVIPIRPVSYDSLESCLGVAVKRKVPVNYIRDKYGVDVRAESDGSTVTWLNKMRDSAADVVSPIWKFSKSNNQTGQDIPRIPTVTLYTCYLKDHRLNETNKPREMGQFTTDRTTGKRVPANNWSYVVQPGQQMYPHLRLIVWCGSRVLYDGPSFYWHGKFPIIKLTLNPMPWSFLGKAPLWDLLRLQTSLNKLLRVVDDHAAQVAQPAAIVDKNSISRSTYDAIDTRRAGMKAYVNPLAGKGITIVPPPPMDQGVWKHIEWIQNEMKELAGVIDLSQLNRLNQLPSTSTVESILNSMTPALRFRSRIYEAFTRQLAEQLAYNFTQFYTLPMRVNELGPGGITQDDFDFDPGSLMPDYVHDGDYKLSTEGQAVITPEALLRGPLPRYDRAREFLRRFVFKIAPGSLLNAAQTEQKLIYLQLCRAGWLDIFTLWESLGIPNIGVLPDAVRTIPERLLYQQQLGLGGDVNPAGRKASAQTGPRVVTKES